MSITVFIRYEIEPTKAPEFETYCRRWMDIIPRLGGDLLGYWMPHEGTNHVAYGLISFDSLAAYEVYRAKIKSDEEGAANFRFAKQERFIRIEERTFLRQLEHVAS